MDSNAWEEASRISSISSHNKPLQQTARPSTALRAVPVRPQLKGVVLGKRRSVCCQVDQGGMLWPGDTAAEGFEAPCLPDGHGGEESVTS